MKLKSVERQEHCRVKLEVEVDAESFEKAVAAAYRKNIRKMNVPGFRRGKAPRHLVEKLYGEGVFYEDAINDLYPQALDDAISEAGLEYVDDTVNLDVQSVGKEGFSFTAEITVQPEITLGEYKGLKAPKTVKEVTDEDIDAEIQRFRERNARMISVDNRPAQNGDVVELSYEGFIDGKPFEGGKAEDYHVKLGSGQLIPGFEDQIVGKPLDEDFEISVTFPDDYGSKQVAGKPAVFRCRLQEIQIEELPEVNDEFAKDCSEFDTLEEWKADIRKKFAEENEKEANEHFQDVLLNKLITEVSVEIPQAMIEHRIQEHIRDLTYQVESHGLTLEKYLEYTDTTQEKLKESLREPSERQVKGRLVLEAIAKAENIVPTEEELETEYQKLADQWGTELETVKKAVDKELLIRDVRMNRALQLITDNAVIEEEQPGAETPDSGTTEAESSTASEAQSENTASKEPAPEAATSNKEA